MVLGTQVGRRLELFNSFELVTTAGDEGAVVDQEFLSSKAEQFKEVFPTLDVLGWYTIGTVPTTRHACLHQQLLSINEAPLMLMLDPTPRPGESDLPVFFYEPVPGLTEDGQAVARFCRASYSLASGEAERVGVNHIAQVSTVADTDGSTTSQLQAHLTAYVNAMGMLLSRVSVIRDYVLAVEAGELPAEQGVLRQINGLCSRLPATDGAAFAATMQRDTGDTLAIAYLATLTKGCNALSEMLDKFQTAHSDGATARRGSFW